MVGKTLAEIFKAEERRKHPGGRPRGVTMPCGWNCGKRLTAREMRVHFTECPKRPAKAAAAR